MGTRRGAALGGVQVGSESAHAPLLVLVACPVGFPGGEMECVGWRISRVQSSLSAADVTPAPLGPNPGGAVLSLAQQPAHSGACGVVGCPQGQPQEPETLESVLAAVEGMNG